jgi:hypothetical protein
MKAFIVRLTDDRIDCDKTNIREQIEDILDDPNIAEFKEFTDENSMFNLIHNVIGNKNIGVTACNIWESKYFLYAGYFIDMTEIIEYDTVKNDDENILLNNIKNAQKNIKINIFGSQITSQHVCSHLVIIKQQLSYTINGNNIKTDTKPTSISTLNEMINVFEKLFIKDGIVIKTDGSMQTYTYIMNPIEHLMLTDTNYSSNYVYHEYEVYTHVMMIVADTREINGVLNESATLLAGKPVNGDVFVAMYRKPEYNENPPYVSMNIDLIKDIMYIRQKSTLLTTGLNRAEKEYINFEKILDLEKKKYEYMPNLTVSEINGECLNKK